MHNAVIYPVGMYDSRLSVYMVQQFIFSQEINNYILVGLFLAVVEGVYRLKDGILHVKPAEEMMFPAGGLRRPTWAGFAAHFGKAHRRG